ncbi:MAG: hypothetical protein QGH31_01420 [Kiritimatiellia bacterium]|nr:hypothetical protein [Kiritimatiellia bacterium]
MAKVGAGGAGDKEKTLQILKSIAPGESEGVLHSGLALSGRDVLDRDYLALPRSLLHRRKAGGGKRAPLL